MDVEFKQKNYPNDYFTKKLRFQFIRFENKNTCWTTFSSQFPVAWSEQNICRMGFILAGQQRTNYFATLQEDPLSQITRKQQPRDFAWAID